MQAHDIRVTIGRRDILHGICMQARAGELTAIVGPNGSGKSTLLKALTAEIDFVGQVELNGRALTDYRPWDLAACRGVLQQSLNVAFPFTVREIVQLGHGAGLSAADPDIPDRALSLVDLDGFANRFYHELSGGEQQRTQLARVLAQVWIEARTDTPRWLFLDEPVSSLDIGHQYVVMDLTRRFTQNGGGVIAVMHDLNLTAMYADHVVLMEAGEVLAAGTASETLTTDLLSRAYGCPVSVNTPAPAGVPFVLPQARARSNLAPAG